MAKDEHTEKDHFNALFQNSDLDSVRFSPTLMEHPDHALIETGICSLGNLQGKRILLLGCGSGKEAWYFVEKGAEVFGMDIAFNYLKIANYGSKKHHYDKHSRFICMSVYLMAFKKATFDHVYGHAILHHLNLEHIGTEISRILKPGGSAIFTEPLDSNPILRFTRDFVPYPGKHRVKGEKALSYKDIKCIAKSFSQCQCKEKQLLSMLVRLFPDEKVFKFLDALDTILFRIFPMLKQFCRAVIVRFTK